MSVPLMRLTLPAKAVHSFHDCLETVVNIPRFGARIAEEERRNAVKNSRIVFFGRREGDPHDPRPLDVLVDPAGHYVAEDIAHMYGIDPKHVEISPLSTLTYGFEARIIRSMSGANNFYGAIDKLLHQYMREKSMRVQKIVRREEENELVVEALVTGKAREVANMYQELPKRLSGLRLEVSSNYLSLDR
jgi:hypothetical protein